MITDCALVFMKERSAPCKIPASSLSEEFSKASDTTLYIDIEYSDNGHSASTVCSDDHYFKPRNVEEYFTAEYENGTAYLSWEPPYTFAPIESYNVNISNATTGQLI